MIINNLNELKQTLIDKNIIINNLTKTSEQTKLDELKIQQQNLKNQTIKIYNEIKYLKKLELNNCHSNKSDHHINENINDEFIYDEENVISILWKTVINSGTVFLEKLYDKNWFNYIFKSENFYENMLISDS